MISPEYSPKTPEEAMRRGAKELGLIESRLISIEAGLEDAVTKAEGSLSAKDLGFLQDLDLVIQSLSAIETYFTKLSDMSEPDFTKKLDEAIVSINIGDVRNRLAGQFSDLSHPEKTDIFL